MKKICLALVLTLSLILSISLSSTKKAAAEDNLEGQVAFTEDFESYTELNVESMRDKWTNGYFYDQGDFNVIGCNPDNFELTKSPTDENNIVLHVNAAKNNNSFFYLTIKDVITKNFVLEFDMMDMHNIAVSDSPWVGIMCRKPVDGRYNGVTNVLNVMRSWGSNAIGWQCYRSVDDSFQTVANCYAQYTCAECGEKGVVTNRINECPVCGSEIQCVGYNYTKEDGSVKGTWVHVKFVAQDTQFTTYIDDYKIGEITITKKTALNQGLVSFASCVSEFYLDNVVLTRGANDIDKLEAAEETENQHQAPTMEVTEYTIKDGESLELNVSLYGEAVTTIKQAAKEVMTKYYEIEGDKITISSEYLDSVVTAGSRKMFIITTEGGSVSFFVAKQQKEVTTTTTVAPVVPTTTIETTSNNGGGQSSKFGCNSSIAITSIAAASIMMAGFIVIKRRREE